jgi:N utilization substance protein A
MNSLELVESFSEFKELKNIDKQTMQHVLEDVFRSMLKKKFNTDEHIDVIVNIDKGDVQR